MNMLFAMDKKRYPNLSGGIIRYLRLFRMAQSCKNPVLKKILHRLNRHFKESHGLEIPDDLNVGGGFYIGHHYGITINPKAILGMNVSVHKGVTIGQENRGEKKEFRLLGTMFGLALMQL